MAENTQNPGAPQQPTPQPAPAPPPRVDRAAERASDRDTLAFLSRRLGLERDFHDELKYSLKDLEKQLQTIDKQNSRLETQYRNTINIKDINGEIRKLEQDQYLVREKRKDIEYELGPLRLQNAQFEIKREKELQDTKLKAESQYRQAEGNLATFKSQQLAVMTEQEFQNLQSIAVERQKLNQEIQAAEQDRIQQIEAAEKRRITSVSLLEKEISDSKRNLESSFAKDREVMENDFATKAQSIQAKIGEKQQEISKISAQQTISENDKIKLAQLQNDLAVQQEEQKNLQATKDYELGFLETMRTSQLDDLNKIHQQKINQINDAATLEKGAVEKMAKERTASAEVGLQKIGPETDTEKELANLMKSSEQKRAQYDLSSQELEAQRESMSEDSLQLRILEQQEKVQEKQAKHLEKKLELEHKVNQNLGLTGHAMQKMADKLGMGEGVYNAMTTKARELTENEKKRSDLQPQLSQAQAAGDKQKAAELGSQLSAMGKAPSLMAKRFQVMGAGAKEVGSNLKDMWKDPLGKLMIFKSLGKNIYSMVLAPVGNAIGAIYHEAGKMVKGLSKHSSNVMGDIAGQVNGIVSKIPIIGGMMAGIIDGFAAFMDLLIGVEDHIVKQGRSIGLSAEQGMALNKQFSELSMKSGSLMMNSDQYLKSLVEINKELGVTVQLSAQDLETHHKLTELAGLDVATSTKLVTLGKIQGTNAASVTKSILGQVAALKNVTGIQMNYQQVLAEVTKLNGVLGLEFQKHPDKITAAVIQTKALGLELSKVEGMASSFLDFQSSISKEFEAQLLTGKNINLSKVRELMLNNDIAGAAAEIAKQAGSAEDFLKMNRLAQDSFAEAMGTSRDELANMLRDQEQMAAFAAKDKKDLQEKVMLMKQQGKEAEAIAKLGSEEAYNSIVNTSMQEKLVSLMDKVKQTMVDMLVNSGVIEKVQGLLKKLEDPNTIREIVFKVRDVFTQVAQMMLEITGGIMKALNYFNLIDTKVVASFERTKESMLAGMATMGSSMIGAQSMDAGQLARSRGMSEDQVAAATNTPKKEKGGPIQQTGVYTVGAGEYVLSKNVVDAIKSDKVVTETPNSQAGTAKNVTNHFTLMLPDMRVLAKGSNTVNQAESNIDYNPIMMTA